MRAETTRLGGLRNSLLIDARSTLRTRVLGCRVRSAARDESEALALPEGAEVWEISRLRLLNERPVIWETSVVPKVLAPDLGAQFEGRATSARSTTCSTRSTP